MLDFIIQSKSATQFCLLQPRIKSLASAFWKTVLKVSRLGHLAQRAPTARRRSPSIEMILLKLVQISL